MPPKKTKCGFGVQINQYIVNYIFTMLLCTLYQHAKKVVSNSLGLVDFAIGLVIFCS